MSQNSFHRQQDDQISTKMGRFIQRREHLKQQVQCGKPVSSRPKSSCQLSLFFFPVLEFGPWLFFHREQWTKGHHWTKDDVRCLLCRKYNLQLSRMGGKSNLRYNVGQARAAAHAVHGEWKFACWNHFADASNINKCNKTDADKIVWWELLCGDLC